MFSYECASLAWETEEYDTREFIGMYRTNKAILMKRKDIERSMYQLVGCTYYRI